MGRTIAYCGCGNLSVDGLNFTRVEEAAVPTLQCAACGAVSSDFEFVPRAERDQLRQQVEGLLSAIDKHRNESSPTSTPQKFSLDGELYAAADQVRKELREG